ncbi:MAG TPA: hypothetical protein IAA99_03450 [Candidatus Avibacteroides faecavium]|nr:hypothetical protein [Candidatus Avibacteroides faecavium]
MIVQALEMARDVRVAIDANIDNAPLLAEEDVDALRLDDIIVSKLADAVRLVEMEAPINMLEQGHQFGKAVTWREDGKGWVLLPDDFMRLVVFKMSDWLHGVSEAISQSDPAYQRQFSRWKGVSGNPERPVVAIVNRAEGNILEFFSCNDSTATVDQAVYIPFPNIDENGGIDVSEKCYRSAVYRAAALSLSSIGDQQGASTMTEISRSLLV